VGASGLKRSRIHEKRNDTRSSARVSKCPKGRYEKSGEIELLPRRSLAMRLCLRAKTEGELNVESRL
jgi:hypothetical protein